MEKEKTKSKRKNLDLIILLSVLAVSIIYSGVVAQLPNQAEGEDAEIYIDFGGFAFQDGKNPSSFIALYTPRGQLNTTENEFFINADGGGKFTFESLDDNLALQFVLSVSANIEGDQGNGARPILHDEDGLSDIYPVDEGDTVTIYWIPTVDYGLALPMISFWGMIGGALLGSVFTGAGIKKRKFDILIVGLIAYLAAFIFYLVFVNI